MQPTHFIPTGEKPHLLNGSHSLWKIGCVQRFAFRPHCDKGVVEPTQVKANKVSGMAAFPVRDRYTKQFIDRHHVARRAEASRRFLVSISRRGAVYADVRRAVVPLRLIV